MNIFETAHEFIDNDVRFRRPVNVSYRIDGEFMQKRHEAMLPVETLNGKTVLDLGCAAGATGYWSLFHGAEKYTGVELQKKMAEDTTEALRMYFKDSRWDIVNSSIESFLEKNIEKFDIIVVSGVIYGIIDYYGFVEKLTKICNECIVIESMHPWKIMDKNGNLTDIKFWEKMIEFPFVQYTPGIRHSHEDGTKSYEYDGIRISQSAFHHIFDHLGWKASDAANDRLASTIPDVYDVKTVVNSDPDNPGNAHLVNTASGPRFVIRAFPVGSASRQDFSNSVSHGNTKFKEW